MDTLGRLGKYPTLSGPAQTSGSPAVDDAAAGSKERDLMGGSATGLPALACPVSGGSTDVGPMGQESQPQVQVTLSLACG